MLKKQVHGILKKQENIFNLNSFDRDDRKYCFYTMKEVSVFIICLLLISVVRGEEDLTCKAGEGVAYGKIFTSGPASQCSGISKITTEAECKLAAEYNSKNNIDTNEGFGGRLSYLYNPPGCLYLSGTNKYYWNDNTKSTTKCSNYRKCICKTKTCTKCPINTYSEGGINPTCTPCPNDRPTTNFKTGQSKCIPVPPITCKPGYGYNGGDGITVPKKCLKCNGRGYSKGGNHAICEDCVYQYELSKNHDDCFDPTEKSNKEKTRRSFKTNGSTERNTK